MTATYCQNCGAKIESSGTYCAHCGEPLAPAAPAPQQTPPAKPGFNLGINWSALFSIRVWLLAIVGGAILGALTTPALSVPAFIVILALAVLNRNLVLYCPYCRKRVKMGATSCHHCGRQVV